MTIRPDWIKHLKAGAWIAFLNLTLWAFEYWVAPDWVRQYPWVFATLNACATGNAVKEACDWLDNQIVPNMHEVSWKDFTAGMVGSGAVILGALLWARHLARLGYLW